MSTCPLQFENGPHKLDEIEVYSYADHRFLKYLQISPDGSQVLVVNDTSVSTYTINQDLIHPHSYYQSDPHGIQDTESINSTYLPSLTHRSVIKTGDSVFDAKWYSLMSIDNPATNCFATSCRDHPIHLWDIESNSIRASYAGYDQYDELDSAYSFTFNQTGDKLYSGTNRVIRAFDLSYPGRNYTELHTCKSKHDFLGQKGIISCMVFNPDFSKTYAVASYANSVGMYVENMEECALEIRNLDIGGISCVRWSPCGRMIWAGGRGCDVITCWDVRKSQQELGRVHRALNTNQKLSFDIDPWGKYLVTGSQQGELLVYETSTFSLVHKTVANSDGIETSHEKSYKRKRDDDIGNDVSSASSPYVGVTTTSTSPYDCINTVAFHPYSSILLSASGQRHFDHANNPFDDSDDSSDDKADDDNSACIQPDDVKHASKPNKQQYTSGIQVWGVHATKLIRDDT